MIYFLFDLVTMSDLLTSVQYTVPISSTDILGAKWVKVLILLESISNIMSSSNTWIIKACRQSHFESYIKSNIFELIVLGIFVVLCFILYRQSTDLLSLVIVEKYLLTIHALMCILLIFKT